MDGAPLSGPGRPLRVLVDGGPLFGPQSGVGNYTSGLLAALAGRPEVDVSVYATTIRGRGHLAAVLPRGVGLRNFPVPGRVLTALWRRGDHPRIERIAGACDVVHGTNFVVPPARAAQLITIHDLSPVTYPQLCDALVLSFPDRIRRALARGAHVHTPSTFVAAEVVDHFDVDPSRVTVVASGIPSLAPAAPPEAVAEIDGFGRYILAVGTIEGRKDYPTLVRAFSAVAAAIPDVRLVIAGRRAGAAAALDAAISASPARNRIVVVGYAAGDYLGELLRRAAVLAYPSLYEGFGYPPLQAMVNGVPVVATDAGAIPETVGDAAEVVPVGDAAAMAAALLGVLGDEARRAALITRGRDRAARFSWERCAAGTLVLYSDLAGR